ncbi:DNA replication/repair protein RecF [Pelagibacteraceae bacterium]|nr:DNA replication/repair protein RecF [Pelagibacteraceae bacterium]
MHSNIFISQIILNNFRSHQNFSINTNSKNIVLHGENGAGKTNILESVSLLSPGRGLRNAKSEEIINKKNGLNFALTTNVKFNDSSIKIQKIHNKNSILKSSIFIDDEKAKSSDLLNYLRVIWITPVMEKIMLQSNSERRNFFDRLIFNIEKNHLKSFAGFNKFTKERLYILKSNEIDSNWLGQIELKIAKYAFEIIMIRKRIIAMINSNLSTISKPFNSCIIDLIYDNSLQLSEDEEIFISHYVEDLSRNRAIDRELNRTILGPNKVEVKMWKLDDKSIEAKYCSTGEQKSILISIILSVAQIIKNSEFENSPIILIDEAMAHLDQNHREALVSELSKLNTQVWYTGVTKNIFDHLSKDTDFFEVKRS